MYVKAQTEKQNTFYKTGTKRLSYKVKKGLKIKDFE